MFKNSLSKVPILKLVSSSLSGRLRSLFQSRFQNWASNLLKWEIILQLKANKVANKSLLRIKPKSYKWLNNIPIQYKEEH